MSEDTGSASVYVLAVSAVIAAMGLAATVMGTAVVARHRAAAAADLGALAAASAAVQGDRAACARAGAVVRANGADLTACRLVGADALVTAGVEDVVFGRRWGSARVAARAGPAVEVESGAGRVRSR